MTPPELVQVQGPVRGTTRRDDKSADRQSGGHGANLYREVPTTGCGRSPKHPPALYSSVRSSPPYSLLMAAVGRRQPCTSGKTKS